MEYAWQVIVVQIQGAQADVNKQQFLPGLVRPAAEQGLPLQIAITYGDEKVSTPLVQARQPLWNFWTQLVDKGGSEDMVFSLVARDVSTGKFLVQGEARLDLSKFRRSGQSVELWEKLLPAKAGEAAADAAVASAILHLTITYCPTNQDDVQAEDTDCQLCTIVRMSRGEGCSIS